MTTKVELQLLADVNKALDEIKRFTKSTSDSAIKAESSFKNLAKNTEGAFANIGKVAKIAGGALVAAFAGKALIGGIKTVTEAASRQQDAVNKLNTALKTSGEFSQAASQDMQDFASAIQSTTKFGDEAIIEQLALAKAFGATNDQAKLVVEAATELAAATGKSLDEATRQVSKTLGGFAGELGEVNPQIKELTKDQLQAGEAAKVLIAQYGGSALGEVNTFSGATAQLSNTFGDLIEEFGFFITNNESVVSAIRILRDTFAGLIGFIGRNEESVGRLITSMTTFAVSLVPNTVRAVGFLIEVFRDFERRLLILERAFSNLQNFVSKLTLGRELESAKTNADNLTLAIASSFTESEKLGTEIEAFAVSIEESIENIKTQSAATKTLADETGNVAKSARDVQKASAEQLAAVKLILSENEKLSLEVANQGATAAEQAKNNLDFALKAIQAKKDELKEAGKLTKEAEKALTAQKDLIKQQSQSKFAKEQLDAYKKITDENERLTLEIKNQGATAEQAARNNLEFALSQLDAKKEELRLAGLLTKEIEDQIDVQKGLVTNRAERDPGEENAPVFGADSGIGGFLGAIDKLSKVVSALQQVVDAVPNLLNQTANLLNSITNFPQVLREALGNLFSSITGIIKDFIPNLIKGAADILVDIFQFLFQDLFLAVEDLFAKLPDIIVGAFTKLVEFIPRFAENLGPLVERVIVGIADAIPLIIDALIESLITNGGLVRIAVALTKALVITLPLALARGFVRAVISLAQSIGTKIAGGILATLGLQALWGKIGGFFSNAVKIPQPKWASDLTNGIKSFSSALIDSFKGIATFLQNIADAISRATGQGGGGVVGAAKRGDAGSFVDQTLGGNRRRAVLGFADGGLVPPGFPNDTFPARLSSGEMVIDRSTLDRLNSFMDQGGAAANTVIKLVVGEKELANVMYNLNRRGFRTA